jgi:hypothetical protein
MSNSVSRYREYAAECVHQAQSESTPEDKTIMLNVALAWLRLARQAEADWQDEGPPTTAPSDEQPELIS